MRQNKTQVGDRGSTGAHNDQGQIQGRKKTVNRNLRPWNSKALLSLLLLLLFLQKCVIIYITEYIQQYLNI